MHAWTPQLVIVEVDVLEGSWEFWEGLYMYVFVTATKFIFDHRCSLKVTVCAVWSKAVVAPPVTPVRSLRSTSRNVSAACRRSMVWARRRSWARGSPNSTPSTGERKTHANTSSAWQPALPPSSFSARTSCMRCSNRFLALRSLSTSCCIMLVR